MFIKIIVIVQKWSKSHWLMIKKWYKFMVSVFRHKCERGKEERCVGGWITTICLIANRLNSFSFLIYCLQSSWQTWCHSIWKTDTNGLWRKNPDVTAKREFRTLRIKVRRFNHIVNPHLDFKNISGMLLRSVHDVRICDDTAIFHLRIVR